MEALKVEEIGFVTVPNVQDAGRHSWHQSSEHEVLWNRCLYFKIRFSPMPTFYFFAFSLEINENWALQGKKPTKLF